MLPDCLINVIIRDAIQLRNINVNKQIYGGAVEMFTKKFFGKNKNVPEYICAIKEILDGYPIIENYSTYENWTNAYNEWDKRYKLIK